MNAVLQNMMDLTEPQFASISDMVRRLSGINLHAGKMPLVRARLAKRLRTLGLCDFDQYLLRVQDDATGQETRQMLDALATNMTHFFREPQHFDVLRDRALPEAKRRHRDDRRIRVWSAGCSSGEEPYSIAMVLKDAMADLDQWDVKVLGTDLSTRMVRMAKEGLYAPQRVRDVPAGMLLRDMTPVEQGHERLYRVKDEVRRYVEFARLNLMDPWPMRGRFDVIFCRNVMIYFEKAIQRKLIERLCDQLVPGGMLLIGHAESLTDMRDRLRYVQPAVYEKV